MPIPDPAVIEMAIDQSAVAILIADSLGRITYANQAIEQLAGVPVARVCGRHFVTLLGQDLEMAEIERIGARVAAGQSWSGPYAGRRADGSRVDIELVVSPVKNEAGVVTHSLAVIRDLTREREAAGVLATELQQQVAIGASLARLDPSDPIGELAGNVASALLTLDGVDFGRVIAFGPRDQGQVIGDESRATPVPPQRRIPAARARYLRDRAALGAWVEAWLPSKEYGRYGRDLEATGLRAVGYAPLRHLGRPVGVMAVGTRDSQGVHVLERHLSALSYFGALASGILGPALAARQHDATARAEIQRLIREHAFRPVFQPIVRLADSEPIGYEALTRFDDGSPPDSRFADALVVGLGVELESATLGAALAAADALPAEAWLSLNVTPHFVIEASTWIRERLRGLTRPIVLEITEQEPIEDYPAIREAIAGLGVAVRWAVDDAGAGYASLRHIIELKPDYVKLDRGLVSGISVDPARQALVAGVLHFGASVGLQIIAEGVETDAERQTLAGLGVELGQGYLFGRPEPAGAAHDHP
jgi:PAS domain S-box-containing protein